MALAAMCGHQEERVRSVDRHRAESTSITMGANSNSASTGKVLLLKVAKVCEQIRAFLDLGDGNGTQQVGSSDLDASGGGARVQW